MSYRRTADFIDAVDEKELRNLFPEEFRTLDEAMKKGSIDIDKLSDFVENDEFDTVNVQNAYNNIIAKFKEKFPGVGLKLFRPSGDVEGDIEQGVSYWQVLDAYQLSPSGEKLQQLCPSFERRLFTSGG